MCIDKVHICDYSVNVFFKVQMQTQGGDNAYRGLVDCIRHISHNNWVRKCNVLCIHFSELYHSMKVCIYIRVSI